VLSLKRKKAHRKHPISLKVFDLFYWKMKRTKLENGEIPFRAENDQVLITNTLFLIQHNSTFFPGHITNEHLPWPRTFTSHSRSDTHRTMVFSCLDAGLKARLERDHAYKTTRAHFKDSLPPPRCNLPPRRTFQPLCYLQAVVRGTTTLADTTIRPLNRQLFKAFSRVYSMSSACRRDRKQHSSVQRSKDETSAYAEMLWANRAHATPQLPCFLINHPTT